MVNFFNLLCYLSPTFINQLREYTVELKLDLAWKRRTKEFFRQGAFHEDWQDANAVPPRTFTTDMDVEGIYYPCFVACDSLYHGYRVPRRGQSIRLGGDARHSLGAAQLADLNDDARPGRLYSGPNGRHQYINDEIPADEI
jgi:hypothetical protein